MFLLSCPDSGTIASKQHRIHDHTKLPLLQELIHGICRDLVLLDTDLLPIHFFISNKLSKYDGQDWSDIQSNYGERVGTWEWNQFCWNTKFHTIGDIIANVDRNDVPNYPKICYQGSSAITKILQREKPSKGSPHEKKTSLRNYKNGKDFIIPPALSKRNATILMNTSDLKQ